MDIASPAAIRSSFRGTDVREVRLDLAVEDDRPAVTLGLVDDGAALWELRGGSGSGTALAPLDAVDVLRTFAGWQRSVGRDLGVPPGAALHPDTTTWTVDVEHGLRLTVPSPDRWCEVEDVNDPVVALTVREPLPTRVASNLVVTADPTDPGPGKVADALIEALDAARLVDARDLPSGFEVVVLHRTDAGDAVLLQRHLDLGGARIVLSATCGVDRAHQQLPRFVALLDGAERVR